MKEKKWKSYEDVARNLLDRFAVTFDLQRVEAKQKVVGHHSGRTVEIDAKGVCQDGKGFIVVECKRHTTSRLNPQRLEALAYRITDTKATGGIIVSPLGLQQGAAKIAQAAKIINVKLDANSTADDFAMSFLKRVMVGVGLHAVQATTKVGTLSVVTESRHS